MQIICVDDEELVLGLNVSLCRDLPQHPDVEGFRFAEEALEWLKKNQADIALLDINMPDMDGIEAARQIRAKLGDAMPILLISANDWSDLEDAAKEAGVSGFVSKPLFRSTLYNKLNELLGRR